ncbi:hypothetical protein V6N12_054316 [Hibiscus sabdariffa]|uniref:Uncharacterized protein n=1 Tax=Hibiscus sabdariffa TaxID=183260 RepID=A0ABR2D031_9ROSI
MSLELQEVHSIRLLVFRSDGDPLVAFVFQIHMLLLPLLSDFSPTNCAALTGRSLFYGVTGHRTPFLT